MAIPVQVRRRIKVILRPAALPLLRRFRLPFDLMLPRIESLEQRVDSIPPPTPLDPAYITTLSNLSATVLGLRGTVDSLTRTWLRLQNEVSRLAGNVPEAAGIAAKAAVSMLLVASSRHPASGSRSRSHCRRWTLVFEVEVDLVSEYVVWFKTLGSNALHLTFDVTAP